MKYKVNEILELIDDRIEKLSAVVQMIGTSSWVASISHEHQQVMDYLRSLQDWIRTMDSTPSWHCADEHGSTIEDKLNNVFTYSYSQLLRGIPIQEHCSLPAATKARIFLDIGTSATNTSPGEKLNLLAATARSGSDDLLALLPLLVDNTQALTPYEFVQVVCADSETKHSISGAGCMEAIFNLVTEPMKAVALIESLGVSLSSELTNILDRFSLEQELATNETSVPRKPKI